jgi:DNA-binding ferritin-like protein
MSTPPGQPTAPRPLTAEDYARAAQQGVGMGMSNKVTGTSTIFMPGMFGAPAGMPEAQARELFGPNGPNTLTYDQAKGLPAQWIQNDPEMLKKLVNKGIINKVPGFDVGMGLPEIMSAWDDLVQASFAANQAGGANGKKWTPWDILDTYSNNKNKYGTVRKGDWEYDVATGERIRYIGATSKTTTSKSVNLSSLEDVQALTTQVLTQALGRAPTANEVAQYKSTINSAQEKNPTVTTTTSQLAGNAETGGVDTVAQNSTTSGGLTDAAAAQMVQNQAKKGPEYGKYQSGTTYYNALMQMLTGG